MSDVEKICTDVALLNNGVVEICGKLADIKAKYKTEEYIIYPEKQEDLSALLNAFPKMKKTGDEQLSFYESDHSSFEILNFAVQNKIAVQKFERVEPDLEALFMEVAKQ